MHFRTEFLVDKSPLSISHKDDILLLGSCFSDNIGSKLLSHWFKVSANPFGTVFNPVSIQRLCEYAVGEKLLLIDDILFNGSYFIHPDFHTQLASTDKEETFQKIQTKIQEVQFFFCSTNVVFITLGTAWVYAFLSSGQIVSNCHKLPQHLFEKKLLTYTDCLNSLKKTIAILKNANPTIEIVLTLSPVRHVKDGLVQNSRSKALLLCAIHDACSTEKVTYFPSYEMVLDDLRDYRFYSSDLIHINDIALDYIWEKFLQFYCKEDTKVHISKIKAIELFKSHRPLIVNDGYQTKMEEIAQQEAQLKQLLF
jgi:hypothetical protein